MIKLLAKIFIKDKTDPRRLRESYGFLCSGAGIGFNILLFVIKFIAGSLCGSLAVSADAFNNLSDSGSSVITLLGFRIAAKKPDPGHPFGHGRVEYLSGLAVAILIIIMGFELLVSSVKKIIAPEPIDTSNVAVVIIILAVSIAVKVYMFLYNRKYGREYGSTAMLATASDSISDAVSTTVVLISTVISLFTNAAVIDAICGTAVSVFILIAGVKAVMETISPLLGAPAEADFVRSVEDIVLSQSDVVGIHDMIVHDYGPGRRMISLHAEVPSDGNLLKMHDAIDNAERELHEKLDCAAVIHMDPVEVNNDEVSELRVRFAEIVSQLGENVSMHDFRIVKGPTHTNFIFDIAVPFRFPMPDREITETVQNKVSLLDSSYFCVITVDKIYVDNVK